VDWLFIRERRLLDADRIRLLHVSPEYSLQARLGSLPNVAYLSADLDSALADERMDVTDIHYEDASFDAVVCNHVLEHVPEDRKAMRELYRVLRPGGWAMVQSPVDRRREETFEDAAITDPADRTRLFGQYDHVRVYGRDYDQRLAEAGFEVEVDDFVQTLDPGAVERMALDRGERIYLCHKPA
jgi:SAM-dependent methyltransferase